MCIELQLYVATCSPARDAGAGYVAWGHSTLIGPVSTIVFKDGVVSIN